MKNFLIEVWDFLAGKKTYIIALLTIILGLLQHNNEMVMTGLIAMGLRNAIPPQN